MDETNVFEYAKKMELDGIALYEEQLNRASHSGMKVIFQMLIDAEKNHYKIFDAMEKHVSPAPVTTFSLSGVKNIFEKMKENNETLDFSEEQAELYKKSLEIEKISEQFYREQAELQTDEKIKEEFLEIAEEEHKHMILMQNMLDFVNRPDEWIENAEFHHLDEY